MKNYLYILCAFLLAFAGCTKDADVEPIAPAPDGNTQVVLTGFSGRGTRTGFGGAEDGAVPFLWSAGDYIFLDLHAGPSPTLRTDLERNGLRL